MGLTLCLDKEVALGDDFLLQLFHSEIVLCAIPSDKIDLAEGASANYLDELKVIQANLLVRLEEILAGLALVSA